MEQSIRVEDELEIKRIRNLDHVPFIDTEGIFVKSLPTPPKSNQDEIWYEGMHPNTRLFYHQTLNSTRRFACFKQYPFIPKVAMDIALSAKYRQNTDLFKDRGDVVAQNVHVAKRLRNSRDLSPDRIVMLDHPLLVSGIKERISPHSVKLMNSGHHTPFTNPGYSRQEGDGNFYRY